MIKKRLFKNARKIDQFLIKFLSQQKYKLLINFLALVSSVFLLFS